MKAYTVSPPSNRTGTALVLSILLGIGLLYNLSCLFLCLSIICFCGVFIVKSAFVTIYHRKEVWIFFSLTGASLLWTEEGRHLAPLLITKMITMWLWVVIWVSWVGFDGILSSLKRMGIPTILIDIIAFTARFFPILQERTKMLIAAQTSRGASKGILPLQMRNIAGAIGSLLLSSFEQAENVERAMRSRGFCGEYLLRKEENSVVSCGSLILLSIFFCIVWAGVVCHVLCSSCTEYHILLSR
ncbi:MAG: energy-coupling factor transporter transmembrane protein EcfT [Candidatus Brocadiaceae bacterium]|nr:energy-coupling factor transporter transmembrane protein EcfT [Candidatus Brocadiaceae bacterium]